MAGLEQGNAAARAASAADAAAQQQDFQNNLATNSDKRAADASALALAQGQNNLDQSKTTFGQPATGLRRQRRSSEVAA